jgi:hypothetical protein
MNLKDDAEDEAATEKTLHLLKEWRLDPLVEGLTNACNLMA